MCLISPPAQGGHLATRTFIPHNCHKSIGVLGAVSVATACLLKGSVGDGIMVVPGGATKTIDIEHPTGSLRLSLDVDTSAPAEKMIRRAGVIRTARTLMKGEVYIPSVL
jgi:4-oxalomesaconate tautomerase